jgi:hypothetical protein
MRSDESWLPLQSFPERERAEALCVHLQVEGVPSKIEARALANAIETEYWVCVPHLLAHRARWRYLR